MLIDIPNSNYFGWVDLPIVPRNIRTGEGMARLHGPDKLKANHKKHLQKKTKLAKISRRRNRK